MFLIDFSSISHCIFWRFLNFSTTCCLTFFLSVFWKPDFRVYTICQFMHSSANPHAHVFYSMNHMVLAHTHFSTNSFLRKGNLAIITFRNKSGVFVRIVFHHSFCMDSQIFIIHPWMENFPEKTRSWARARIGWAGARIGWAGARIGWTGASGISRKKINHGSTESAHRSH